MNEGEAGSPSAGGYTLDLLDDMKLTMRIDTPPNFVYNTPLAEDDSEVDATEDDSSSSRDIVVPMSGVDEPNIDQNITFVGVTSQIDDRKWLY